MAKEYIEREATLKDKVFLKGSYVGEEYARGYLDALDDVEKAIRAIPAANVRENVKAYWWDIGSLSCRCSNCGCKNNKETIFCPNCGAEMGDMEDGE